MTSDALALLGGPKVRTKPFPAYPVIGPEERQAVLDVLDEGRLSTFIASKGENFLGGRRIREFERAFAEKTGTKYAVAFNSATAALHAAVVAVGVNPGEEVIVPPYTFTSTASCALMHGAIPVFADVDPLTFCIDPASVERAIGPLTRAIIPVHLFGQAAPMDELLDLARRKNLTIIEDAAQAPAAAYRGRMLGTLGACGVFSFQESKNLMTGEGGMLVTDDLAIAEVCQLVRNHGEAVAESFTHRTYMSEILGWNYRMTEFEAALGLAQLRKIDEQNHARQVLADHLTKRLNSVPGLMTPVVREGCDHVYYVYPLIVDEVRLGLPRDLFAEAVKAEGIPLGVGYVKPLYFSPLYQNRRAPAFEHYRGTASYAPGICPVAEELHTKTLVLIADCRPPATEEDMDDIVKAIDKVLRNRDALLAARGQGARS